MMSNRIVTLALTIVFVGAAACQAGERTKADPPTPFKVVAGSCSRSMRVVSAYETAMAAIRAADQLRREERYTHIGVARGEAIDALDFHASFRANARPDSVSVFEVGCKSCTLLGTLAMIADADALAKRITVDNGVAALVFNYNGEGGD